MQNFIVGRAGGQPLGLSAVTVLHTEGVTPAHAKASYKTSVRQNFRVIPVCNEPPWRSCRSLMCATSFCVNRMTLQPASCPPFRSIFSQISRSLGCKSRLH